MKEATDRFDHIDEGLEGLVDSMDAARVATAAFDAELSRMQATTIDTGREIRAMSGGVAHGMRSAVEGVVFGGEKVSDALRSMAQSMIDAAYNAAVKPVYGHMGGVVAAGVESFVTGAFADGGAFTQGRVMPFAKGGGRDRADDLSDARWHRAYGRSGAGGDHALASGR